jgi:hypothetical protein
VGGLVRVFLSFFPTTTIKHLWGGTGHGGDGRNIYIYIYMGELFFWSGEVTAEMIRAAVHGGKYMERIYIFFFKKNGRKKVTAEMIRAVVHGGK